MDSMISPKLFSAGVGCVLLLALAAPADAVLLDDFNRPDGPLGPNWTVTSGACSVVSQQAACSPQLTTAIFNGGRGNVVSADLYQRNQLDDYGALILGYQDSLNHLYIKLQNQDNVAGFEAIGFYFGSNGQNNGAWSNSGFLPRALPDIAQARMTVSLLGTNLQLDLDTDFDSVSDFTFVRNDVPVGLLGTGIGMSGWTARGTRIDNFSSNAAPVPEPATLALLSLGLAGVGFKVRRRRGR